MADIKISALPITSVVNPADIVVLNQSGTTKTATKSVLTSGLATTAQISGIATTAQLSAFQNSAQVQALASAQIAAITPASIGALSTDAASGFATTDQISGFTNSAQVQSLASAQIAAITPASIGAFATSAIIAISNGGTGATDAVSALANLGGITSAQVPAFDSAQLSAYVLKSGSTMDGRLVMAATTAQAKANIGGALSGVAAPSSSIAGDVWVSNQSRLTFSPSTGVAVALAGTSQANTFNQTQTIGVGGTTNSLVVSNNGTGRAATFTAASTVAAVAITQTGVGEAFRVEDETSPDTTAFVISNSGRVGIGVTPDAVTALSVDGGGIKFADGSIATTALGGLNSAQVQSLTTAQLSAISISAGEGLSGGGDISASRTLQLAALTTEAVSLGSATEVPTITVDTFGRIASTGNATITPEGIGAIGGQYWSASRTYNIGDIVSVDDTGLSLGQLYVSIIDGNTNNSPLLTGGQYWAYVKADAKSIVSAEIIGTPTGQQTLTFNSSNGTFVFNTIDAAWVGAAPLDSPAFTGTPTAPTAAAHTNTTQLATTEFVISNRGDSYLTTSTSPQTIGNGTKTFTVEAGLSYTPTQDVTIVYDASNHMHGLVVTYSGTTLVVDVTQHTGSGSYSLWTLNVGGLTTAAGALLSANNLSDVANTATALTNIGGVSTARSVSAGTGLTGGGDLTANRTLSIAALSPDPTGTYGSTSQIPSLTVNNLGQVTAVSLLSFRAPEAQVFDAVGTSPYSKPEGARLIRVQLWSGGGGGASGRKGADGTIRCAGGGGGSGGYYDSIFDASVVSSPINVVVGGGGNGGSAQTGSDQNGTNGQGGTASSFGTLVTLPGGNGGSGGTATAGFGGGGSISGNTGSGASGTGAGGVQGIPGTSGATSTLASGSGASGGGLTTGNATAAGNTGGRFNFLALAGGSLGLAGATGATPTSGGNGGAGASMASIPSNGTPIGAGGGGGGGSANGAGVSGGSGGNGGFPAGGGGGGGAASNACVASGAGGAGGAGCAVITAYF